MHLQESLCETFYWYFISLMTKYEKFILYIFIVASQPIGVMESVQGCGHAKSANLAPATGLEEQDETGNWKCQNNISKFIFNGSRIDLIMKLENFIFYRLISMLINR